MVSPAWFSLQCLLQIREGFCLILAGNKQTPRCEGWRVIDVLLVLALSDTAEAKDGGRIRE